MTNDVVTISNDLVRVTYSIRLMVAGKCPLCRSDREHWHALIHSCEWMPGKTGNVKTLLAEASLAAAFDHSCRLAAAPRN